MVLAVIDIGTNSCRLLIQDIKDGIPNTIKRSIETPRIGRGVHDSGVISAEAMDKTEKCLRRFMEDTSSSEVVRLRVFATSALREAANSFEFIGRIKENLGISIEVISGDEEAELSYIGVSKGLALNSPVLVADLGGGSTEFVWKSNTLVTISIPLGAVRAYENRADLDMIREALNPLLTYKNQIDKLPLVFVGGTATTLVAIKKRLINYDPMQIHGEFLTSQEIRDCIYMLKALSPEKRKNLPGLEAGRSDIIDTGATIVYSIMELLEKDYITISESDILNGAIWKLFEM